jgi:hypothetical protein
VAEAVNHRPDLFHLFDPVCKKGLFNDGSEFKRVFHLSVAKFFVAKFFAMTIDRFNLLQIPGN